MSNTNKTETIYVCSECGADNPKWSGKCSVCGAWNTLKEMKNEGSATQHFHIVPKEIRSIDKIATENFKRFKTGMNEVDRVLGGGIIPGSVILIGGDPGIGKSTMLMQVASKLHDVLYISGEESQEQIKLRANRLGVVSNKIRLFTGTDVLEISKIISDTKDITKLVIIDSIQTIFDPNIPSTPGSVIQVRECALKLQQIAKNYHIPVVLIGHVTKDGNVAGPKTLEHLVDVVLYFEGEHYHNTRILRGMKNRYGATDEIGVFEMTEKGFREIDNPSKLFLKERLNDSPGSVVTATMEGTRPFLVEIQALTLSTIFGYPKRTSSGFDLNRLQILIAVISKRTGINLNNQDVFLNVVGGFKLKEPAVDLAVCMAIISAFKNQPVLENMCVFGEVGLSGEIRSVSFPEKRKIEADRLGYNKIISANVLRKAVETALK